jgi:5-methylthioribose kinase
MFTLTLENVESYLTAKGIIKHGEVKNKRKLGGGVSSTVILIESNTKRIVLKQPLIGERAQAVWVKDQPAWRVLVEADCIDYLNRLSLSKVLPKILFTDKENYIICMSAAPNGSISWKERLLNSYEIDSELSIAKHLGTILSEIQSKTYRNNETNALFRRLEEFQLARINPIYLELITKYKNLESVLSSAINQLLNEKAVLVLGDYTPKNVLINRNDIFLIDFEIAHYGNIAFDPALMMAHLFLMSIHRKDRYDKMFNIVDEFWRSYLDALAKEVSIDRGYLEQLVTQHALILMLGRIDGIARVEDYLTINDEAIAREVAVSLLLSGCMDLNSIKHYIAERID